MNRAAFRRFEFFDVDTISEDVATKLGCLPTCAIAESGMLIFGDNKGHVTFADRDFHISDHRHKIFKGEVLGLAYLFDPANSSRQFVFALGDDSRASAAEENGEGLLIPPMYAIKVFATADMTRPLHTLNATAALSAPTAAQTHTHEEDRESGAGAAVVTSFAVSLDGCQIAVGYSSGRVALFTGLFLRESSSQSRVNTLPVILRERHFAPVSGLHFCDWPALSHTHANAAAGAAAAAAEERRAKLFVVMDTRAAEEERNNATHNKINYINSSVYESEDEIAHAGILVFDTSYAYVNAQRTSIAYAPRGEPRALDERGAGPQCTSFLRATRELAVARNEALYTYTVEDRGGALAIFGEKLCLSAVGRYTLVVAIDEKPDAQPQSQAQQKARKPQVNIYDLKNKTICGTARKFTLPATEKVLFSLSDSGIVYLITSSLHMIRFQEKNVNRKLDVLLNQVQPPLFSQAIQLAGEEQMEPTEIMKLYKMYGDHLYNQHEYEAAVTQYCSTIGYIPPSYVIIKFLDPYRINDLVIYLEKIKEKMFAGPDHMTLLLSCYAKLKDEKKINELLDFVYGQSIKLAARKTGASHSHTHSDGKSLAVSAQSDFSDKDIFEPLQAIRILTSAGFSEQALKVCVKYLQHDSYFSIQLGKSPPQFDEALGYLAYTVFVCSPADVLRTITRHGRALLAARPEAFTHLLVKLCTGDWEFFLPSTAASSGAVNKKTSSGVVPPVSSSAGEANASNIWSSDFWRVLHTLLSSAQKQQQQTQGQSQTQKGMFPTSLMPQEPVLQAEEVLGLFHTHTQHNTENDHLVYLQLFLDEVIAQSRGKSLSAKVWMTALELKMQQFQETSLLLEACKKKEVTGSVAVSVSGKESVSERSSEGELSARLKSIEQTIMSYLDGATVQYDASQVLLLCNLFNFEKGEKFLLERETYVELLLQRTSDSGDAKEMLKLLRKEGGKEPELFVQVLTYFVQRTLEQETERERERERRSRATLRDRISVGDDEEEEEEESDFEEEDEEDESKWDNVVDVLDLIEKESILSPAQVLSILSINPSLPLHVVSDYVANTFRELSESVAAVENDVHSAALNLETIVDSEIQTLRLKRAQERAQRRAKIGYDDDDDDDDDLDEELQNLQREKEKWVSIRKKQIKASADHESFFKELDNSTDGFSTIASYFGRSLIMES